MDDQTVHFTLQSPNSRFHSIFSVRWNGAWIMPEHIFSGVENLLEYDFADPVGLGPYVPHSYDPNGNWYIWEKREDWDRTSVADFGEPAPQYVIYRNNMPIDNRLIEMRNGDLDMIHDLSPEGMFSIVEEEDTVRGWFPGFPYAHPDPTLPMFIFNHQNEKFQDRRVRWALALMLDARGMSMASYRGAATLSAISIPPTGTHPDDYHIPMQEELINFELDTGESVIKPYNPDIGLDVAEMVRPEFGDEVPTDEDAIRRAFGYGWWNQDLDAAAELLRSAGFTEDGGGWTMPNGEPFEFTMMIPADGVINRLGTIAAQMWSQAGVPVTAEVQEPWGNAWDRQAAGDYEANVAWSVETWGGHPDLSFFLDSYHSELHRRAGRATAGAQLDALGESRARPDHRGDPHRPLRRSRAQRGARPRVRQAPSPGDAQHSGHVLQRVRGVVGALLDGLSDLGESVRQSGEQLGQCQVHPDPARTGRRLTPEGAGGCPAVVPGTRHRLGGRVRVPCSPTGHRRGKAVDEGLFVVCAQALHADDRRHLRRGLGGISDHPSLTGQPRRKHARRITARSNFSPEAIEEMRAALTDLYGVDKPLPEQYANFWRRFVQGDFGPSLLAFPTPSMTLVMRALPWTVFLLSISVLVTWSLGNLFGGLAGLLPEQPPAQGLRGGGDGRSADPLLHRRLPLPDLLRVRVADPADLGRLCHGRRAGVEHRLHPLGHPACDPAGHVAHRRRVRDLVPGDEGAGLEHRHRGLCDLRRACRGAAQTRGLPPM